MLAARRGVARTQYSDARNCDSRCRANRQRAATCAPCSRSCVPAATRRRRWRSSSAAPASALSASSELCLLLGGD